MELQIADLRRFATSKISIYADDHNPPHFHSEGRGFRAIVEIATFYIRAGDVRTAADAMAWARANQALLQAEWRRLNRRPRG